MPRYESSRTRLFVSFPLTIIQAPHDETGERMFTIMGTAKANESALFLLYENLEAEKMRRANPPSE